MRSRGNPISHMQGSSRSNSQLEVDPRRAKREQHYLWLMKYVLTGLWSELGLALWIDNVTSNRELSKRFRRWAQIPEAFMTATHSDSLCPLVTQRILLSSVDITSDAGKIRRVSAAPKHSPPSPHWFSAETGRISTEDGSTQPPFNLDTAPTDLHRWTGPSPRQSTDGSQDQPGAWTPGSSECMAWPFLAAPASPQHPVRVNEGTWLIVSFSFMWGGNGTELGTGDDS
jgi:hypothetical protein